MDCNFCLFCLIYCKLSPLLNAICSKSNSSFRFSFFISSRFGVLTLKRFLFWMHSSINYFYCLSSNNHVEYYPFCIKIGIFLIFFCFFYFWIFCYSISSSLSDSSIWNFLSLEDSLIFISFNSKFSNCSSKSYFYFFKFS